MPHTVQASFEGLELQLASAWQSLRQLIDQIMTKTNGYLSHDDYMAFYHKVFSLLTTKRVSDRENPFVDGLYTLLKTYFARHLEAILSGPEFLTDEELLLFYAEEWLKYADNVSYLERLFPSFNRQLSRINLDSDSGRTRYYHVYALALMQWDEIMLKPIQTRLVEALSILKKKQLAKEVVDLRPCTLASESFAYIDLCKRDADSWKTAPGIENYINHFEAPFIDAAKAYFMAASDAFIAENGVVAYLPKAREWLMREEKHPTMRLLRHQRADVTRTKLIGACKHVLFHERSEAIAAQVHKLLQDGEEGMIQGMYSSYADVPEIMASIRKGIEEHLKSVGLLAVENFVCVQGSDNVGVEEYIAKLFEIRAELLEKVNRISAGDERSLGALDMAFQSIVSQNAFTGPSSTKGPEILAKHADVLLRKSNDLGENEPYSALDQVIFLVGYIGQKDVFQFYYTEALAKRLLYGVSVSEDVETYVINKLRVVCGSECADKLQRMFTDLAVSKDLTKQFKEEYGTSHSDNIDPNLSVMVLSSHIWPLDAPSDNFRIPQAFLPLCTRFQEFYRQKHTGRKLNWLWLYSKNEIHTNYTTRKHILTTSTYQMAVLVQYNDRDSLTLQELVDCTGLSQEILKQVLTILAKARILLHDKEADAYDLNLNFKANKVRLNLNQPIKTVVKSESEEMLRTLEAERRYALQAVIVRIMKTQKKMQNQSLIQETVAQISRRFIPRISDIKIAIDALLEKEYIERVDGEKDTFVYTA